MSDAANTLRALVVEDSTTIRKYLAGVLRAHGVEVVGEAENGVQALELCRTLRPDVVTMDMILPEMSGLAATEQIMAFCPTPILIVSASVNRGEVFQTYDALAAGAVDVFDKVRASDAGTGGAWEERFVAAVRMTARIKVITHPRARLRPATAFTRESHAPAASESLSLEAVRGEGSTPALSRPDAGHASASRLDLVALGASTGGPAALVESCAAFRLTTPSRS